MLTKIRCDFGQIYIHTYTYLIWKHVHLLCQAVPFVPAKVNGPSGIRPSLESAAPKVVNITAPVDCSWGRGNLEPRLGGICLFRWSPKPPRAADRSHRASRLPVVGFGVEAEHARVCFPHLHVLGSSSSQTVTAQLFTVLAGFQIACDGFLRIPGLKKTWTILALI